jgi:hypothetical protein
MIIDYLCTPNNSDGLVKDDKDETLANLLCFALSCKNAARRVVYHCAYLRCELETKSVLWRDTVIHRQPCSEYLHHLYSETYPGPSLLVFCDKRRREWLCDLGGKRLGEWVASGRRRGGVTMSATVCLPVTGVFVGVLLGQLWTWAVGHP